jgi:hypothetical protein
MVSRVVSSQPSLPALNPTSATDESTSSDVTYFDLDKEARASVRKWAIRAYLHQSLPWFNDWVARKGISPEQVGKAIEFVAEVFSSRFTIIWTNYVTFIGSKRKATAVFGDEEDKCECGAKKVFTCSICETLPKVPTTNATT